LAGKTVIGAVVRASPQFGDPFGEARTDSTGAYQLAGLPAGRLMVAALRDGSALGSRQIADVPEGGVARLDLTLAEEGLLTGMVLEPGGAPSAGAFVMVLSANQRVIFAVPADDSGAFHVDRARSDLPDVFDVSAMNGGRMGKTSVATGQTQTAIQLQPAATLRGHVASSAKVDGFTMTITIKQGGRMSWFGAGPPGGMQRQFQFAGDQFVADDLPATDVSVHVVTSDGRTGDGAASLVSGQPYQLDIALQDAGNVLGRV